MFPKFLESLNLTTKGAWINGTTIERLKMPWRNATNHVDCGVYTMRHLETYMGQKVKDWDCGLASRTAKNTLKLLRVKYCSKLIACTSNDNSSFFCKQAEKYFTSNCDVKKFDLQKFIDSYKKPK